MVQQLIQLHINLKNIWVHGEITFGAILTFRTFKFSNSVQSGSLVILSNMKWQPPKVCVMFLKIKHLLNQCLLQHDKWEKKTHTT